MSEKIELQVEVHSEAVSEDSGEKETTTADGNNPETLGEVSDKREESAAEKVESGTSQQKAEAQSESAETKKKDIVEDSNVEEGEESAKDKESPDKEERDGQKTKAKREGGSPLLIGTEERATGSNDGLHNEQQQQSNDGGVQQEPTTMTSTESERVAPVCQLARAQASMQAKMRPGMWLPGVRNFHMAREVWEIKATPDECLDKLVAAVDAVPQEELMEVSKMDKNRHFVEIFAFTKNCNWLDVVEVTFHNGEEPGTTRGEIVSFSSGLFPAWLPLSFVCSCCCFYIPFSGNGQNTRRIGLIRNALELDVTVKH